MLNEKEYGRIIARNLRRLIYERGKTQAEVARDLNINKATLSSWMNGTRIPKMSNIDKLCKYFGVSRSEIMEPEGQPHPAALTDDRAELIRLTMTAEEENVHFALNLLKRLENK